MDVHIDKGNGNGNANNNGSGMSLRELVAKNERAMHGMSGRFGDVNSLREQLEQVLALFENQKEILTKEVEILCGKIAEMDESSGKKLLALKNVVVADYKSVEKCKVALVEEIEEIRQMKKELFDQMEEVKKVVNKKAKRQKYLWSGVGVLALGLVFCLGYLCNEQRHTAEQLQELKVNIDSSMSEVKGAILFCAMGKVTKEKDLSKVKKK